MYHEPESANEGVCFKTYVDQDGKVTIDFAERRCKVFRQRSHKAEKSQK